MTPPERLVARAMQSELDDDVAEHYAVIRVANQLGIKRDQALNLWMRAKRYER